MALKLPERVHEQEAKGILLGQVPKHRFILLVWMLFYDNSMSFTRKENM